MLLFAVLLAAAPQADFQILASPPFDALIKRTDAMCPARKIRFIKPAELDGFQESFEAQLTHAKRKRLTTANVADKRCADRNGLSCPVTATLEAMEKTAMLGSFADYICAHPAAG